MSAIINNKWIRIRKKNLILAKTIIPFENLQYLTECFIYGTFAKFL